MTFRNGKGAVGIERFLFLKSPSPQAVAPRLPGKHNAFSRNLALLPSFAGQGRHNQRAVLIDVAESAILTFLDFQDDI
jgi:hypothetical protein